jgi:hypothetical protein
METEIYEASKMGVVPVAPMAPLRALGHLG